MAEPARKIATYADVLAAPPHVVAEIVGGVLHTFPRPAPRHTAASSGLGSCLGPPFQFGSGGPGGWWILDEPELHLCDGEAIVVPDLAGWRAGTMPELPETAYFVQAPDWICEVLSPSTEAFDRAEKMPVYAQAGVGHAWLVDPVVRTLEVFRLHQGKWLLIETHRDNAVVRAEPFDAVELPLAVLWGKPAVIGSP